MIYFSLGLPGPVARWCDAAIAKLLMRCCGENIAQITSPTADALPAYRGRNAAEGAAVALIREKAAHLMIGVHEPDEALKQILAETNTRFILALDDPRTAAVDLARHHGMIAATRAVACACPFTAECLDLPAAHRVTLNDLADGGHNALRAIAYHLLMDLDPDAADAIVGDLAPLLHLQAWDHGLSECDRKLVDGALGAYAARFSGHPLHDLVWTPDLFILGSDPARAPSVPIPLRDVGNGLFVVYGPYLRLPVGYWSATVAIGVSRDAVGQTFTIDAYGGRRLAVERFCPRSEGIFNIPLDFATDAVTGRNIEIRIVVGRNSAPGELLFHHVRVHPVALRNRGEVVKRHDDYRAAVS